MLGRIVEAQSVENFRGIDTFVLEGEKKMELKLADDNPNKPLERERETERNPWDPPAGDYGQPDDWNMKLDMEPLPVSKSVLADELQARGNGHDLIIVISGIIVYCLYIALIGSIIWLTKQDVVMVYENIEKIKSIPSIMVLYTIIDAFLVYFLYEKRASLFVFAFLLSPFYPMRRNKVIHGSSGIGAFVTLGYFASFVAMFVFLYNGFSTYGNILKADNNVKQESRMLLDQTTENGKTYSSVINNYLTIGNAELEEQGGKTYLAIAGAGSISLEDSSTYTVGAKNVPTTLVFIKDTASGQYKICAAVLGDKQLTEYGAVSYWKMIENN